MSRQCPKTVDKTCPDDQKIKRCIFEKNAEVVRTCFTCPQSLELTC